MTVNPYTEGPAKLPSERVVLAAPLSFQGSLARLWPAMTGHYHGWAEAGMVSLAVLSVILVWSFIVCWYVTFGLLLVPFRMVRRTQRTGKRNQLRHQEIIAATLLKNQ
jgi:hypothetical protein